MSALVVALIVGVYLFLGGLIGFATRLRLMGKCPSCSAHKYCYYGHQFGLPIAVGVLWPLAIPVVGGACVANRVATSDGIQADVPGLFDVNGGRS